MKRKDVADSSFSSTNVHGGHNKESKGRGRGRRGGHDNTSQVHDNANPQKDKSMIKCYSGGKYEHQAVECCKKKQDDEANLTFTHD